MKHDVVAIGGSAGAIDVLLGMVGELPADLPAAIFVVVHTPPERSSRLPQLLSQRGPLPASHPVHGEKIQAGRIYVAPPDNHLLVRSGAMAVVRGPRENGHRPAADALFRSAAAAFGPRVVGVVLSGHQDCGTAGMMSIKARGGIGVVQAPDSAIAPAMPTSVLERVEVDHVVHPLELPGLIAKLVRTNASAPAEPDRTVRQLEGREPGARAEVVCPACHGVLTEAQANDYHEFRCHVGHVFSLDSLVREQSEETERALWAAVRSLEESAAMSRRLSRSPGELAPRFADKAETLQSHADHIREILLRGGLLSQTDVAE